ncbi:MAG: hypothetical protein H7255_14585 [Ramlibacter sp.]|nr:hypothetical protein [Ramlibacter sp.]
MPYEIIESGTGRYEVLGDAPTSVKAGAELNSIPRQLGLTARYGVEGLANSAQIVTEPLRQLVTDPIARMFGAGAGEQKRPISRSLGEEASRLADWIGLPKPETANERVIGDAAKLVAGVGGLGAAGRAAQAAPGVVGQVGQMLSANIGQQAGGAAGAGLASGASREAGGSATMQGIAGLAGGFAGNAGVAAGSSIAESVSRAAKSLTNRVTPQQMDQQISAILQRADVDYSQIPNATKAALRKDLADALKTGQELDPQAVARLADFRTVGATPTRGMVSQNPVQITREMNLAKIGANTADDQLQGLPQIQNENNTKFIQNLNEAGATRGNPMVAGEAAIGGIRGKDEELKSGVNALYAAAREMPGGTISLERKTLVDNIYGSLAKENKMAFLPESVDNYLKQFSAGVINVGGKQHEVPFDANALDNLMTTIATAQRGTQDGNVKAALNSVRKAIDTTPIQPQKTVFGGNQVVTEGGANYLRSQDAQAGQFMEALNEARGAAKQRFGWQESSKPIEAALGGMEPDKFVQRFVVNGSVADARSVAQNAPVAEVKDAILAHLKSKAIGGASDEVGKFSQSSFNKALSELGDRKLALFFSPEEIGRLRALGRVSSYAQVQPVGSAVNNSNSGALMLGKSYDALMGLANKVPGFGPLVVPPIKNIEISLRNQQAKNVLPGLLATAAQEERQPFAQGLLLPGFALGGLLAAPTTP